MGIKSWFRRVVLRKKPSSKVSFKPVFIEGKLINVSIDRLTGMNKETTDFFIRAMEIVSVIANSKEFKKRVLNPKRFLEHTNGLNLNQIYENFLSGKSSIERGVDRTLNVDYNLYYTISNTVGYVITGDSNDRINYNKKFLAFDVNGLATIVGNFFHEDRHNAGFVHEETGYSRFNVPYFYGDISKQMALEYLIGRNSQWIDAYDEDDTAIKSSRTTYSIEINDHIPFKNSLLNLLRNKFSNLSIELFYYKNLNIKKYKMRAYLYKIGGLTYDLYLTESLFKLEYTSIFREISLLLNEVKYSLERNHFFSSSECAKRANDYLEKLIDKRRDIYLSELREIKKRSLKELSSSSCL